MQRRKFLSGAVLSGFSLAIAGCAGDEDDAQRADELTGDDANGETDDTDEPTGDGTDDDEGEADEADDGGDEEEAETVESLLSAADETLDEAESRMEEELDAADPDNPGRLDPEPVSQLLDEAEADVDRARELATEAERPEVEALGSVVTFMREILAAFIDFVDVLERLEMVDELIEQDDWEAVVAELEEGEQSMVGANQQLEAAQAALEEVDRDELHILDQLRFEDLDEDLAELQGLFRGIGPMLTGIRQFAEGVPALEAGEAALEDEEFEAAADEFAFATERFGAAVETLTVEGELPTEFERDIDQLRCEYTAIRDASERFEAGSLHFADEEWDAGQEAFETGDQYLDEADHC